MGRLFKIGKERTGERMRNLTGFLAVFLCLSSFLWAQEARLSPEDERFLDDVERKAFDYFLLEHHPKTGLVKDKAVNAGNDQSRISSIAATGFGLTAICVGAERGWIGKQKAQQYCLKTLRFALKQLPSQRGFFYHFVDWETGKPMKYSEVSSIDTALLLAGALTAGEYFKGTEVEALSQALYERVDFPWMLNGGDTLSMGWKPDTGFLKERWNSYNESLILYLLAIASPAHPIPPDSWKAVKKKIGLYGSRVLIYCPPLFTHQYPQVWLDLRNKNDGVADYFENSRVATIVNREFCIDQSGKYKTYSGNIWGLTACMGPDGYKAYGAEPGGAVHDGTVAPTAAGGSFVFTPELSLKALRAMASDFKEKIWGKYGFCDAFNLNRSWFSNEVIGIDQGPMVLMIENFRTEMVWRLFMKNPLVGQGLEKMGFREGTLRLRKPRKPLIEIPERNREIVIDGDLNDWDLARPTELRAKKHCEVGEIRDDRDLSGDFYFAWDEDSLYVAACVHDESLVMERGQDKIWRDDCIELFINPDGNGLRWGNSKDVQLGLSPSGSGNAVRGWAWFQSCNPLERGLVEARVRRKVEGYDLEARISWKLSRMTPETGLKFGLSPAVHDADYDKSDSKANLFFIPDGKSGCFILGKAVLRGVKN